MICWDRTMRSSCLGFGRLWWSLTGPSRCTCGPCQSPNPKNLLQSTSLSHPRLPSPVKVGSDEEESVHLHLLPLRPHLQPLQLHLPWSRCLMYRLTHTPLPCLLLHHPHCPVQVDLPQSRLMLVQARRRYRDRPTVHCSLVRRAKSPKAPKAPRNLEHVDSVLRHRRETRAVNAMAGARCPSG